MSMATDKDIDLEQTIDLKELCEEEDEKCLIEIENFEKSDGEITWENYTESKEYKESGKFKNK